MRKYEITKVDGFDVIIHEKRYKEYMKLCEYYEKKIGNDEIGKLEYTEFKWIWQTSVNDYIALRKDGTVKKKGDFSTDIELYRNKSRRIVPLALENYIVNGGNVGEFIKNHKNIYDFCIRQKASSNFHYEGVRGNEKTLYDKLIRYYVSNSGEKLYKIKNPDYISRAPNRSQIEAGKWLCTVCNHLPKSTKVEDCDINYEYYIWKVENILKKMDKSYKTVRTDGQLMLWEL